jgi:putative peptidoglycan lipid II flippase
LKSYEAIFRSLLHIRHHFLLPTLAPLVYNSLFIILLVALFPSMRSESYVIGMLVATVLQTLVVVVPFMFLKTMLHTEPTQTSASNFDSSAYIKFLATVTVIETIGILADPFDRYIAGLYLDPGYVSATNYANITFFSPVRILIYSVSTAIFPLLAKYAATNEKTKLAESYHRALAYVILFMIPATVFLYLFRHEVVHLLFERGKFDADSHIKTVQILEYYLFATPFFSMFLIQSRIFYALRAWLPFGIIRIIAIAAKAAVGFALIRYDWAMALGGGTVLLFLISAFAGEAYLWGKQGIALTKETSPLFAKALMATVITSGILWLCRYLLTSVFGLSGIAPLVVCLVLTAGLLIYLDSHFAISGISPKSLFSRRLKG